MTMIRVELHPMDTRICPLCSGAGWYYVEAPGHKPIPFVIKKCTRFHLTHAMESVEAPAGLPQSAQSAPVIR